MKKVIACTLLILSFTVAGCGPTPISKAKGEARVSLFKDCMEAAANIPRQSDDDVSDIVSECSVQSYYMTNWME
jgi:hypothetical protein